MADLRLDPDTRDLIINGEPEWTAGIETVMQRILLRLTTVAGEWRFDLDYGLENPLGSKDRAQVVASVRKLITETEGVSELTEFNAQFDTVTRTLSVNYRVRAGEEYDNGSLDI